MRNRWEMRSVVLCVAFSVVMFATLFTGGKSLQIEELRVPDAIKNGSEASVILDCDYKLLDTDSPHGLVVKWYFNNNPMPVYQWIINQKPQEFGVLKGRLNLDYRASEDEYKMYRALQINNPTPDLSGEYKCQVSTFYNETSQTKKMVIYVPEKSLEVTQTKEKGNSAVNVTCAAEGVFPEPRMAIQREEKSDLGQLQEYKVLREDGVYDIIVSIVIEDENLDSPTTFSCELKIPEANYTVKTSSIYYPGPPTTTTEAPPTTRTELVPASSPTVGGAPSRGLVTWLLLLPLVLCLRL